ncbi:hypothetical protein K0M31_009316, partial [Melipona bicolor]
VLNFDIEDDMMHARENAMRSLHRSHRCLRNACLPEASSSNDLTCHGNSHRRNFDRNTRQICCSKKFIATVLQDERRKTKEIGNIASTRFLWNANQESFQKGGDERCNCATCAAIIEVDCSENSTECVLRESENDPPPEQGETFYLFAANEEERKSESLHKLAPYSRGKLYNARVTVSQGIGNMCAQRVPDKEPL